MLPRRMAAFQALQPDQDLIQLLSGGTAVGVDVDRRHVLIRRAPPMREVIVVGGAPYDGEPRLSAAMPRSRYTRATFPMSRRSLWAMALLWSHGDADRKK